MATKVKSGIQIKVDGVPVAVDAGNGKQFQLEELQRLVGGYIQIVGRIGGKLVYADEDGTPKGLPVNRIASEKLGKVIVGTVFIV
jgi:hypothetical protein